MKPASCEPIAITGMACRFPGAGSLNEFWSLLTEGRDGIGPVPLERWNADALFDTDPRAPGKTNSRYGGFLQDIDRFDAAFFGISPREATQMDPQQRILLEVAYEAMEDAGIAPTSLAGSDTAVFIGAMTNDYFRQQLSDGYRRIDVHTGSGAGLCMLANRLSYQFDLRGPSATVDTACSSSLVAVFQACQSLWTRQTQLALAGGVNVMLDPGINVFYAKAGLSAPDGRCKTFSASANGIGRGEGAAVIVLKRLGEALAQGDPIYAVIRGGAVNHDGRSNGLTQPNRWAQQQLLRRAFEHASIDPREIEYIELHGTGTLIGDPIEANALGAVLAEAGERQAPCLVGSVKTNLGHLEAAAGIAGLVKLALSIWHATLPPSLWFDAPNPHIAFEANQLQINATLSPWPALRSRRLGGVSSFGLGGTNAHLVLESAPAVRTLTRARPRPTPTQHCLFLSARSESALKALARAYGEFLAGTAESALPTVCATALSRKAVHEFRLSVFGRDAQALIEALHAFACGHEHPSLVHGRYRPSHRKILLALPQLMQLQRQRWSRYLLAGRLAREAWNLCRNAFAEHGEHTLPPLDELAHGADIPAAHPRFNDWHFATQYALCKQLLAGLVEVELILADGIGQLAALCASGALEVASAVRWLRAGLSAEFVRTAALPQPRYTVTCDFACGRAPALESIHWHSGQQPWHERLRMGAGPMTADVIVLGPPEPAHAGLKLQEPAGRLLVLAADADDLPRLFTQLAMRHPLQWAAWADEGEFIRLPSYPWQRESYWITKSGEGAVPTAGPKHNETARPAQPVQPLGSTLDGSGTGGATTRHHALLGSRLPDPAMAWQSQVSTAGLPWLRDHRVQGLIVLPGSAYPEIGLAIQHALTGQPCGTIHALRINQALVLEDGVPCQLRVSYDLGTREYAVYSRSAGSDTLIEHARGQLSPAAAVPRPKIQVDELRQRCRQAIDGDSHHDQALRRGLQYGPYFRGVQRLWLDEAHEEVLAWIALRDLLGLSNDRLHVHPALLDAALQSLLTAISARGDASLYVPVGIREVRVHALLPREGFWCHGRLLPAPPDALAGDLVLFDEQGEVLIEVLGVHARALAPQALQQQLLAGIDQWLYQLTWQALAQPSALPRQTDDGRCILFLDRAGVGERLLAQPGFAHAIQILPGEHYARLDSARYCIRPAEPEQLRQVFAQIGVQPNDRIVYLWGLDMPGIDDLAAAPAQALAAVHLLQLLQQQGEPAQVVFVTRQSQSLLTDPPTEPTGQSHLIGLARVAANECAPLRVKSIDIDADERTLGCLCREVLSDGEEEELALRADQRYARRLVRTSTAALAAAAPAPAPRWRSDASYLISGGLGGFGLSIAQWMVEEGARYLVLVGRHGADTTAASAAVERLRSQAAQVLTFAVDVSQDAELAGLLAQIAQRMPPLRGVFHAAGVLEDGPIADLQAPILERVMRPKTLGAWRLHQHTRDLELDHFVLFSSFAVMVGNPGQAAYVMANSSLDTLAAYRRKRNLPAVSISWGALGEVGMAARSASLLQHLRRSGAGLFTPTQATQLLGRVLDLAPVELGLAIMNWQAFAAAHPRIAAAPKFAALMAAATGAPPASLAAGVAALSMLDSQARCAVILPALRQLLAQTLQLQPQDIEPDVSMLRMGIDSLMAMDLQASVEKQYGIKISTLELMKGATLLQLAQSIAARLGAREHVESEHEPAAAALPLDPAALQLDPAEQPEDVESLIARLDELTDAEVDRLVATLSADQEAQP